MRPFHVDFSVANITLHPANPDGSQYVALFKRMFKLHRAIKVHGSTHAMLGSMYEIVEGHPEEGLHGDIFRFVQIDLNAEWLDTRNLKAVSSDDAKMEVSIPEHLKPNLQRSRYVFYPKKHRLVFVSHSYKVDLSPNLAEKLLKALISDRAVIEKFPSVEVIIEQSVDVLNEIFSDMHLNQLKIVIKRPNPDGPDGDDASIESILDAQGAREQRIELRHETGTFLKPNDRNRRLAKVAISNGFVYAEGIDGYGVKTTKNTAHHPFRQRMPYSYKQQDFIAWFVTQAKKIVDKILKK